MILDSETAYAKINLALHVRRREADGYHAIETLFAFCADGDEVQLTDKAGLRIIGREGAGLSPGADNLVLRARDAFAAATGLGGDAGFVLDKRLPVASGIGGGSADAAAVLRLLSRRYAIAGDDPRIAALARALGADVPACLASTPSRGTGRGDVLTPASGVGGVPLLLVNPGTAVSTAAVFAAWDGRDGGALTDGATLAVAAAARNDLEAPARAIAPAIGQVLALLAEQPDTTLVRMSGSGATCFALFADTRARDAAAVAIGTVQPGWWTLATVLR